MTPNPVTIANDLNMLLSLFPTLYHYQIITVLFNSNSDYEQELHWAREQGCKFTSPKQTLRVIDGTSLTTLPALPVMYGDVSHSPSCAPSPLLDIIYRLNFTKCVGVFFISAAVCFLALLIFSSVWGAPLNCLSVCQAFGQVPKVAARRFQFPWASPVFDMLRQTPHSRPCVHRPSYGTKTVLPVFWQGLPQGW